MVLSGSKGSGEEYQGLYRVLERREGGGRIGSDQQGLPLEIVPKLGFSGGMPEDGFVLVALGERNGLPVPGTRASPCWGAVPGIAFPGLTPAPGGLMPELGFTPVVGFTPVTALNPLGVTPMAGPRGPGTPTFGLMLAFGFNPDPNLGLAPEPKLKLGTVGAMDPGLARGGGAERV